MPAVTPQSATSNVAPMAQFAGGAPPITGIQTNWQGVSLGSVDPNQLASAQLAGYLRGGNPLVQNAAQQGEALAAARGQGANSSIYGASAAGGAIDALRPVAESDAARYGAVQDQNLGYMNQQNIEAMGNRTSIHVASIGAAAQRQAIDEQARQFNIQQQNRTQERAWQQADQRAAARASQRSQTFNTLLQTVFSDPSYWRDPGAAMGMFNTYTSNIDSMLNNLFPEYAAQPGDNQP
jgi:hypothetical protein